MNNTLLRISEFSDLHKDAYGFRPSPGQWAAWAEMSEADLDEVEADLYKASAASAEAEAEAEAYAALRFEKYLSKLQADFRIDRATALRWDMETSPTISRFTVSRPIAITTGSRTITSRPTSSQ
jgi:hypothetical protein